MKSFSAKTIYYKKQLVILIASFVLFTSIKAQTITINQQLFAGGTYRDSSNITVPIDIDARGTNGFGYNRRTNSVDTNYFILVIIPVSQAATPINDTLNSTLALLGGMKIGRYHLIKNLFPPFYHDTYTTFVNGVIPKNFLGAGINSASYVLKVISVKPFVSSDATVPIRIQRTIAPVVKSFAVAGSIGNTTAINYDPTHSAMFFGFCGPIVNKNGSQLDTSISLLDSTAGSFNTSNSYDSVILVKNDFNTLINTNTVVYRSMVTKLGSILFPSGILKAREYYTLLMKAKDDSGFMSSKSYFILNSGWTFNIIRTSSGSSGCKGDTVSLFSVINNLQAGQQFGLINNFPGLIYSVNWGDPKNPGTYFYSYTQLLISGGMISHRYDTASCFRPYGSQYFPVSASMENPFQGYNCASPIANQSVQIFSSAYARIAHHSPVCAWNAIDTGSITLQDSSWGGANINCTGSAYYKWYRSYVGCGSINDTISNPLVAVDSSAVLQGGVYVPVAVSHYNYKDIYIQPGKYILKLVADNKTCMATSNIDSIMVVARPKANFFFDSIGLPVKNIIGCSPFMVNVINQSDSTCSQKWNFKWAVVDSFTNKVIPPGNIYTIQPPYSDTSFAPVFVFNQQGIYKLRLIGSNACTLSDTAYKMLYVVGNGGVSFPNGNKGINPNGFKVNAFCVYSASKTVNFDSSVKTPTEDLVLKPSFGGTPGAVTPYTWTITDIQGTHSLIGATTINSKFPRITFTTPVNQDGIYFIKVTYSSTCGISSDSFLLYLNRQVIPKITNPTKDTFSICANTSILEFDGTVTAANGSNSGYSSVVWTDMSNNTVFGNGLTAFLTNVSTKIISFKAIKTQPNGCPDTIYTRRIGVTPYATGRDTTFSICSGTKLNFNLDSTSKSGNTYTWTSLSTSGTIFGYNNCYGGCGHFIKDSLVGNGAQGQVIYMVTPTGANGCAGNPFYVTVNILPYPIINLTAAYDTICSGANSHVFVSSSVIGALYNWSYKADAMLQQIGSQTPYTNNIPTMQSGSYLDIIFPNTGTSLASYTIYASLFVANSCSSPIDSIVMHVIPGPTQPKANMPSDSIYLCNQYSVTLNATPPSIAKGEIGTWSQFTPPYAVFSTVSETHNPTASPFIGPSNSFVMVWTITSPIALSFGCPSLSDSVYIINRPSVTTANAGRDTVICNYTGSGFSVPVYGNVDPSRPWEKGTWTCNNQNANEKFSSTGTNSSTKLNEQYILNTGAAGEYDVVWTITNDAGCPASFNTVKIFARPVVPKPIASTTTSIVNIGDTIHLMASQVVSRLYNWVGPNNFSSMLQNPFVSNATLLAAGQYAVNTMDFYGCKSDTSVVNIAVSGSFTVMGSVITPLKQIVKTVSINTNVNPSVVYTDNTGNYTLPLTNTGSLTITPYKNNDINKTNGVTTLDIAFTQSHVLSKNILNSPYKLIAADVNGDGKVSTLDIVYMKRLILGIDTTFTNAITKQKRLWAFVDSSYQFPVTTNPFPHKDSISYSVLNVNKTNQTFIGCKLGDVNWDWNPAIARPMLNEVNAVELSYSSNAFGAADEVRIPIRVKNFKEIMGMQYTIHFNPLALKWVGLDKNTLHFETGTNHATEGTITFLWNDPYNEVKTLEDGSILFEMMFKRIDKGQLITDNENTLKLDGSITAVEAIDKDYGVHGIVLIPKGIEHINPLQQETWVVAPNPSTDGVIHVQMNLIENKTIIFRLSDSYGRILLSKKVEGIKGRNSISLVAENKLPERVYYLQGIGMEAEKIKQIQIK
ncbi:MAG: PKD-like domain-containing protein [Bacteroidota bacterium]